MWNGIYRKRMFWQSFSTSLKSLLRLFLFFYLAVFPLSLGKCSHSLFSLGSVFFLTLQFPLRWMMSLSKQTSSVHVYTPPRASAACHAPLCSNIPPELFSLFSFIHLILCLIHSNLTLHSHLHGTDEQMSPMSFLLLNSKFNVLPSFYLIISQILHNWSLPPPQ